MSALSQKEEQCLDYLAQLAKGDVTGQILDAQVLDGNLYLVLSQPPQQQHAFSEAPCRVHWRLPHDEAERRQLVPRGTHASRYRFAPRALRSMVWVALRTQEDNVKVLLASPEWRWVYERLMHEMIDEYVDEQALLLTTDDEEPPRPAVPETWDELDALLQPLDPTSNTYPGHIFAFFNPGAVEFRTVHGVTFALKTLKLDQ